MDQAKRNHKKTVQDFKAELAIAQQERQTAQDKIKLLESQLERESSTHSESRERLQNSEVSAFAGGHLEWR